MMNERHSQRPRAGSPATLLLSSIALGAAQCANAQSATDETAVNTLQEVVVTAQKRAQTVDKTSVAVTALTTDQLQAAGVVTIRDLTSAAPNVEIHTIGPVGYSGIAIRGISNQDFSQLGSPAVATYVDGVYVAVSSALTGGFYDIERMEILRGPQGTTYGQNATGGNVNIVTADPKRQFEASADVSYGNYNDMQTHGMLNVPVTDDLAIRAAFTSHRSDGYFNTEGTTARNYAAADEFGARVTAAWTPAESFKWRLSFDGFVNKGTPSNMLLQQGPDGTPANGRSPYSQPFSGPHPEPQIDLNSYSIRSRMDWTLTDGLALAYIAGYQHQNSTFVFGIIGGATEVYDGDWVDHVKAYSNELNLTFNRGRLQNILGASQFSKSNPYAKAFHFYAFGANIDIPGGAHQTSAGLFDQATFSVLDNLRLIGGIRRSHETQDTEGSFDSVICGIPAGPPVTFAAIFAQRGPGCITQNTPYARGSWWNTSWKGGLEWDVTNRALFYLTATNGFKSGEVQPGLPAPFTPYVNPEQVINYEMGIKARLLDGRLNVRAAVFNEDYKRIQVTQVTTVNNFPYVFTENAGAARIYGPELEWQSLLSQHDHLDGFINYLHATYTHYLNAVDGQTGNIIPNLNGNYLPNAPQFSARLQYSHDFPLPNGATLTPMAAVYYQSTSYLREFNFFIDRVGGYSKTNLDLAYVDPSRHWTASAFVQNLENKSIRSTGNTAANSYFSDYLAPRLYGVRVSYAY